MARAERLQVSVAYSPRAGEVDETTLSLEPGAALADALQASGVLQRHGLGEPGELKVGIWGRAKPLDTPLREHDRVEVYRPLQVDPKEARRLRYRKQGRQSKAVRAGG